MSARNLKAVPSSLGADRVWRYMCPYIYVPLVLYSLIYGSNGGVCLLTVPVFTFVFVPMLDILVGIDPFNPDKEESGVLHNDSRFSAITCMWAPVQIILITLGLLCVNKHNLLGLVFTVGLTGGVVGINFAHELMHKTSSLETFLATVIMSSVSYPHFCIEHVLGHHKTVATLQDSATSRFGESLYQFYPRTVLGGLRSAWNIEVKRLQRIGDTNLVLNTSNRMMRYAVLMATLYAAVYCLFGLRGLVFFIFQGVVAFSTLEVINYLEHYGLLRRELSPGVFEQVQPKHSWNSGSRMTNYLLINLGRHSDHHTNSSKRYQALINETESAPQLPFGYGAMFVIALLPPLWFRMVNPLVKDWNAKITKLQ